MLKLINISKSYPGFALEGVSFEVKKSECLALMGRSGSGKSLLLRIIAGITAHDKGSVIVDGENAGEIKTQQRGCILMHQGNTLFPHLAVYDNIRFPLRKSGKQKKIIDNKIFEIAEKTGIKHLLSRHPAGLSGGEAQRVALARALVTKPRLLMLDEPFSSLDLELKDDLTVLLNNIKNDGQTIIVVTHNLEEASALADKIVVLDKGSLAQYDATEVVLQKPNNSFMARLIGLRNFFPAEFTTAVDDLHESVVTIAQGLISIRINNPGFEGKGFLIADHNRLKLFPFDEINRSGGDDNWLKGDVTGVVRKRSVIEINVFCGVNLVVYIPYEQSEVFGFSLGMRVAIELPKNALSAIEVVH